MKTLYFDCFSGISGDMVIGALIDAGADPSFMEEELKKLIIEEEYKLQWKKVIKNGITGTKFDVILTEQNSHHHDHSHSHDHHHSHRSYKEIAGMIEAAGFNEPVTAMSLAIFKKIGEAEGRIHSIPLEDVHFHEVGAVDSIIDIIGAAILIDQLSVQSIQSSAITAGTGRIRIAHGIYPVPAPATLEILKGVPIAGTDIRAELATPTGAAIAAVLADTFGPLPSMTVEAIGYGAGTKTFKEHPNVLRVMIGES
ncbi:nickel pincer cofactor biosynthesis protein LarC [Bacillus aerolatus]|uniref:Nickel pincer cofactor biosynthesis protein LarC n=1 Tax=Bacillus aerolatus TaxID=2653354 RepID=A0A6I1FW81_9BACI|nr:nickel pincer cofactor biosynthesis protein LarC [Bacillus aerolatus]KAB7709183.1 nickel pincer cofactor biosynthesis protein LarC [Bacillus aerolatus]